MQPWFSGPFDDPRYINHSGRTRHQWSLVHAGTLGLEVGTGFRIGGIRLAGSNLDSQSDGRSHQWGTCLSRSSSSSSRPVTPWID